MIVLVLGAVVFGRRALTMRNVAIAALLVIVTDPSSVFRASFQLSFAAVIALVGIWELVRPPEGKDQSLVIRFANYLGGIVATSVVAGLATLLFSVYHFQQTSPLGVLGNLLSLPLVGFVMMPAALVATLLMPLGLESLPLIVLGWSIDRMLDLAAITASWSSALNASPLLTPLALGLGLVAFAWFAFLPTWHRLIGPALMVPAVLFFALDQSAGCADRRHDAGDRHARHNRSRTGRWQGHSFAVNVWRETYCQDRRARSAAELRQRRLLRPKPARLQCRHRQGSGGLLRGLRDRRPGHLRASSAARLRGRAVIDADTLARAAPTGCAGRPTSTSSRCAPPSRH